MSELNHKLTERVEAWLNRAFEKQPPYVAFDCIRLSRPTAQANAFNIFVAVGIDAEGSREVLGLAVGGQDQRGGWMNFIGRLKERELRDVKLFITGAHAGLSESLAALYPSVEHQLDLVHFYRATCSLLPSVKVRPVAVLLKSIHACDDRSSARLKAEQIAAKLMRTRLIKAAVFLLEHVEETFSYYDLPIGHRHLFRSTGPLGRLTRDVRRHISQMGAVVDRDSALLLVAARMRHMENVRWSRKSHAKIGSKAEPFPETNGWNREAVPVAKETEPATEPSPRSSE